MIDNQRGFGGFTEGFLRHALTTPDRVAIVHGGREWTYGEILEEALRWAGRLAEIAPEDRQQRVGIFTQRSHAEHIGKLAALFVGATFVPLNPEFPAERTAEMVHQTGADTVIADGPASSQLPAIFDVVESGYGDQRPAILLPESRGHALPPGASPTVFDAINIVHAEPLSVAKIAKPAPDDIAYIIFTSGSTGKPKAIPITHANAHAYFDFTLKRFDFRTDDVFALTFNSTFDLSLFGPFVAWEKGARSVIMSKAEVVNPVEFLNEHEVTFWYSVPSVARQLIREGKLKPDSLPLLRHSWFCGEPLTREVAEGWQAAAPASRVVNQYGPTEGTLTIAHYVWNPEKSPTELHHDLVPVGRINDGHSYIIADENGDEVGPGQVGELWIAGPQVFQGYLPTSGVDGTPFADRFEGARTVRYYRTGDIVVSAPDGLMTYLNRNDQQVKLLGNRIELGEVEAVLRDAGAASAIVAVWPPDDPGMLISAVVGDVDMEVAGSRLTSVMVPQRVFQMDSMPLSPNGKVERRAIVEKLADLMTPGGGASDALSIDDVSRLVAGELGIDVSQVGPDAALHTTERWDSLAQQRISLALSERLGREIGPEHDRQLKSVAGIMAFIEGRNVERPLDRSLRGLRIAETKTTHVDPAGIRLSHCGYDVRELARYATYEQVAYLLLHRELPDNGQLSAFEARLASLRGIPAAVIEVMRSLAAINAHPMDALAAGLAVLGAQYAVGRGSAGFEKMPDARKAALCLVAQAPGLVAAHHRLRQSQDPIPPDRNLKHIENYLHMLGLPRTRKNIEVLTKDAILGADIGASASTFAAIVANGTHASIHAAAATAAFVFTGRRHGYATVDALDQLADLDEPEEVKRVVNEWLDAGKVVSGIGHTVYGSRGDPRLEQYREAAAEAAIAVGNEVELAKADAFIEAAVGREPKQYPNPDVYIGVLCRSLGLPLDLSVPLSLSYRLVGVFANVLEQREADQPLIRPDMEYTGVPSRAFPQENIIVNRYQPACGWDE